MLSRTADHLYWASRYIERAESVARFLDVANTLSLSGGRARDCWRPVLTIAGGAEDYTARYGNAVNGVDVLTWAVLDPSSGSSIFACLRAARENVHAVRSVLPHEVWEVINAAWLYMKELDGAGLRQMGLAGFCEWVKEQSHMARGAAQGTMLRDEAYHFVRLGTFVERADNTARLLGVRAAGVGATPAAVLDPADQLHWAAVLRSVSAYKAYRALTRGDVTPQGVAEMLIMNGNMPRSLMACLHGMLTILTSVSPNSEATRRVGALHARLRYGRMDMLLEKGLDEFARGFLMENAAVANQITADFLMGA